MIETFEVQEHVSNKLQSLGFSTGAHGSLVGLKRIFEPTQKFELIRLAS